MVHTCRARTSCGGVGNGVVVVGGDDGGGAVRIGTLCSPPSLCTQLGHEYVASDDLEGAMTAYRNALRADARHYNAM
jgi:hypothetical protein